MKRTILIISLFLILTLSLGLVACSDMTLYKFVLDAPRVKVDGLTISWSEIENAKKYKIYNAETNDYIAQTENTNYKFSDVVDALKVYVEAYFEKEDFRFNHSDKSNTVTVTSLRLETPTLTSTENVVSWDEIKDADHYKIFDNKNDQQVAETTNAFYEFTNNANPNLNVYVRAYYNHPELEGKKSDKSNIVKVNPDIVEIDVSQYESATEYVVEQYVQSITFSGKSAYPLSISIDDRTSKLDIIFDGLDVINDDTSILTANNTDYDINLKIIGTCSLTSQYFDAIKAYKLNVTGQSDAILNVTGGKGADGTRGTDGRDGYGDGDRGLNGSNGSNGSVGYNGLNLSVLNVSNIKLNAIGGNGGDGGNGGTGGIGGIGKTYVHILNGGKDGTKNYGGNGGNGGDGGDGGAPGFGISSNCKINNNGTATISNTKGQYGRGGKGGYGGNGGTGGNYYNEWGSVWQCSGGSGGNGGKGGNGSVAGEGGTGGSVGSKGSGKPVSGLGLGIPGSTFSDNNNPSPGDDGADGQVLS